jgi:preprotein translocase subunit SecE
MARAPRSQRRARREAQTQSKVDRARARQAQVRPSSQPVRQQTGRKEAKQRGRFVREAYAELKKVEWPNRNQVVQGTLAVIVACAIVGAFLWAADQAFSNLVEKVLLTMVAG